MDHGAYEELLLLLSLKLTNVVISVAAKKTKSPTELVGELVDYGFSSSVDTRSFAEEIFARVPRKSTGVNVSFSMRCCKLYWSCVFSFEGFGTRCFLVSVSRRSMSIDVVLVGFLNFFYSSISSTNNVKQRQLC